MPETKKGFETTVLSVEDLVRVDKEFASKDNFNTIKTEQKSPSIAEKILRSYLAGEVHNYKKLAEQIIINEIPSEEVALISTVKSATSTVNQLADLLRKMHIDIVKQKDGSLSQEDFMQRFKKDITLATKIIKRVI